MHGQATPRPKLCSDLRQRCQGLARRHCSNLSQVRFAQPPGGQPGATPNMARVGMDRLCSSEGLLGKSHRLRCQVLVQHLQSQGAWPHRLQPIHLTQLQAILAAAGIPSEAHIASASALLREKTSLVHRVENHLKVRAGRYQQASQQRRNGTLLNQTGYGRQEVPLDALATSLDYQVHLAPLMSPLRSPISMHLCIYIYICIYIYTYISRYLYLYLYLYLCIYVSM